eukprot:289738-Hanusia_phi.AAC.2
MQREQELRRKEDECEGGAGWRCGLTRTTAKEEIEKKKEEMEKERLKQMVDREAIQQEKAAARSGTTHSSSPSSLSLSRPPPTFPLSLIPSQSGMLSAWNEPTRTRTTRKFSGRCSRCSSSPSPSPSPPLPPLPPPPVLLSLTAPPVFDCSSSLALVSSLSPLPSPPIFHQVRVLAEELETRAREVAGMKQEVSGLRGRGAGG